MLGRNQSPYGFSKNLVYSNNAETVIHTPKHRTTSQPTTRGSKSDNLAWLKPGLYLKVKALARSSLSRSLAPKNSHGHEKSISQLRKSHFQKHHLRQFEGCIFFVEISMFFRQPVRQRPEQRRWRWVLGSWRFGDINSGIQTGDMTGEFQFNKDWRIAVTFVGRESWLRILVTKNFT